MTYTDSSSYSQNGQSPPAQTPAPGSDWSYATQDLLDAIPRPWTRGLLYLLTGFIVVVLPWTLSYKIEETGTAAGRLEPVQGTVKLESPISGQVSAVPVEVGEEVQAGDVLLELDAESLRFQLQQAEARLRGLRDRISQIQLQKRQIESAMQVQRFQGQTQATEQQTEIDKANQQQSSLEQLIGIESTRLARSQAKVERYRQLFESGAISEQDLENVASELNERQKILAQLRSERQQTQTNLSREQATYRRIASTSDLNLIESEQQIQELDTQITDLRAEIEQTQSEIEQFNYQLDQRIITADRSGVLFQLPVSKPGAVVQQNQLVAEIAPQHEKLILNADLSTAESGSVREGMAVKLKFDAYPFQDYGVVDGVLISKSPTSNVSQSQTDRSSFEIEVALEDPCIQPQGSCIPFAPGDTAIAEVVIEERRVIDYILNPFKKIQAGGLQFD